MQIVQPCVTSGRDGAFGGRDGEIPVASGSVYAALPTECFGQERGITRRARRTLVMRQSAVENAVLLEAQAFVDFLPGFERVVTGGHASNRRGEVSGMTIEYPSWSYVTWIAFEDGYLSPPVVEGVEVVEVVEVIPSRLQVAASTASLDPSTPRHPRHLSLLTLPEQDAG